MMQPTREVLRLLGGQPVGSAVVDALGHLAAAGRPDAHVWAALRAALVQAVDDMHPHERVVRAVADMTDQAFDALTSGLGPLWAAAAQPTVEQLLLKACTGELHGARAWIRWHQEQLEAEADQLTRSDPT